MQFAVDKDDNRIWIEDTFSNQAYFCPYCGTELITKKGDIRRHHFAHRSLQACKDSWIRNSKYDESSWHYDWQNEFPACNREIKLELGQVKHRADVIVDQTVIEFQHSLLSELDFNERNNFYFDLGYKVIWLFDLSDLYESKRISFINVNNRLIHSWENPKKCFNAFDVEAGTIDLFFQIDNSDKCIVRVTNVSDHGFERFITTLLMSKAEFLNYVGLKNGECEQPHINDFANKGEYQAFKEKYSIILNPQQERAMLSTEGSVLLLDVPGSGKTTVLVDRLGYMILQKNISPNNILALTYNRKATLEMRTRFEDKFGSNFNVDFKTINALADQIYSQSCSEAGVVRRRVINDSVKNNLLRDIYKHYSDRKYPSFDDVNALSTAIDFIKNMELYGNDNDYFQTSIDLNFVDRSIPNLTQMYNAYQEELNKAKVMDFDDQIYFALMCMKKHSTILREYREKYRYICVDEAQDTSKLQHQVIKLLAEGNNLFMVGDEDQCIYGFRGAYPKALLNFRFDYQNPLILKMEINYRSTPEIVSGAQKFISQYTGRYNKTMTAFRSTHEKVKILNVSSRIAQYKDLVSRIMESQNETAVLCRNNDSLLPLIDFFRTNGITYNFRKPNMRFFEIESIRVMLSYLRLWANPNDVELYWKLNNKGILHIDRKLLNYVIKEIRNNGRTLLDILTNCNDDTQKEELGDLISLDLTIRNRAHEVTADAIQLILNQSSGNKYDVLNKGLGQIEILKIIAEAYPQITDFLKHVENLNQFYNSDAFDPSSRVTLSTVHNSKGLEFNTVYIIDVFDGRFPASSKNTYSNSKDLFDSEREERRLFYVALTRAKDNLFLYSLADNRSTYINEIRLQGSSECDEINISNWNNKGEAESTVNNEI